MTTALRNPYLLAALAFLLLLAIAFLVLPTLVAPAPAVHHLFGAGLTPNLMYHHG